MSNPKILTYIPFANNGRKNTVPVDRSSGMDERLATQKEGFPDITMIPKNSGGQPPDGQDLNGYLNQLSIDTVHRQSGQQMQYDADFCKAIGGYSKGSVLQSTDLSTFWISYLDNNMSNPDSSSSNGWNRFAYTPVASSTTTGTVKIADNLSSTATDTALTANRGKILNDKMTQMTSRNIRAVDQGYQELRNPDGTVALIYQWGTVSYDSQPKEIQVDITFKEAFPTMCLNVQATRIMAKHSTNGDGNAVIIQNTISTKGVSFSLQTYNDQNTADLRGFTWFAIGY